MLVSFIDILPMIPKNPAILLSYVNAKLRDEYPSLTELCAALDADETALRETLAGLDYRYEPVYNQFISISAKEV